jgi:hypothetical protein
MNRREFVYTVAGTIAELCPGTPRAGAFAETPHVAHSVKEYQSDPATIAQCGPDPLPLGNETVNALKANVAERSASTAESEPKGMWIQRWNDPRQFFAWKILAADPDEYSVDVLVSGAPGSKIEIAGPLNTIGVSIAEGNDHWGNNWNKISVPGKLVLPGGTSTVTVRSPNPTGIASNKNAYEGMALLSLELIPQSHKELIEKRIQKARSTAKWLADARYGLMFQWGEWGFPEQGEGMPWPKMIDDFDVDRFADNVQSSGAGYVVWSVTWRTYYFPAPILAIEQIMPGRTSKRDLIGELADALNSRGIRLVHYYHCGYGDREWQVRNFATTDPNQIGMDHQFRTNWIAIINEIGKRYGSRLAGWFIDEGWYPSPFEEQNRALKAGNPDRLVSFNDWVRPRLTDFQDVQFGEGFNGLNDGAARLYPNGPPIGGDGIYAEGPHKGLQAHGMFILDGAGYGWEWGIWKPDTSISKPRWTNEQIIQMAKYAKQRNVALTFNLLMYEDGTVSKDSLAAVRLFGDTVRKKDDG